jgi:hypothetical protein
MIIIINIIEILCVLALACFAGFAGLINSDISINQKDIVLKIIYGFAGLIGFILGIFLIYVYFSGLFHEMLLADAIRLRG